LASIDDGSLVRVPNYKMMDLIVLVLRRNSWVFILIRGVFDYNKT